MNSKIKLVLIGVVGVLAVILMCIFGIQGSQNKAISMEEQVNTAQSDIKVQEKEELISYIISLIQLNSTISMKLTP